MSWSKVNMAAGACWGILAHHEVAQLNPELTPLCPLPFQPRVK